MKRESIHSLSLPLVSIVIATWNKRDDCLLCLTSVKKLDYPKEKLEIIVVDNASTDGTGEAIKKRFPQAVIVRLERNKGFGGGVNAGIRRSKGKYVYILDNDVVVDPRALKELVSQMEKDGSIGFSAGKVYDWRDRDKFQIVYGRIDRQTFHVYTTGTGEKDHGQYDKIRVVDFVSIGSGLARREMLDKVGLLEERYFVYFDDPDLFTACKRAGYKIVFVPTAKVWHKGAVNRGVPNCQVVYYLQRNNLLIRNKFNKFTWIDHLKNFRFLVTLVLSFFWVKNKGEHWAVIKGVIDFYRGYYGPASNSFL